MDNLNEFAWKFSLNIFLRDAEVKSSSVVERKFQIWKFEIFTVLVSELMYSFTGITKCPSSNIKQSIYSGLDSKALLSASDKRNPCMNHVFIYHLENSLSN
uniref:Uncharacterized protein n=1 Tax=Opuntia streptacantha TaxID=393608 RepID=A0A7C9ACE3_OPUST